MLLQACHYTAIMYLSETKMDFQTKQEVCSVGWPSSRDEASRWMLWSTPFPPNTKQERWGKINISIDQTWQWITKCWVGLKAQVCFVPSLQTNGDSSNFGCYHVMGAKSASCTIVNQNQAHHLQKPEGWDGSSSLYRKEVYWKSNYQLTSGLQFLRILGWGKQTVDITSWAGNEPATCCLMLYWGHGGGVRWKQLQSPNYWVNEMKHTHKHTHIQNVAAKTNERAEYYRR